MSCFFIADPRFAFTFLVELESHEQEGAVKQRKPILEPDFYGMPAIIGRSSKPHNQSKNNSAGLEEWILSVLVARWGWWIYYSCTAVVYLVVRRGASKLLAL
jgi:hypothetical protein